MFPSLPRAVIGAVLLDLAVSPLFAWDVFTGTLGRELEVGATSLALVFSVGLASFTVGVLVGGRAADSVPARRLALVTAGGVTAGLLGSGVAGSVPVLVVTFGLVVGGATGLGYATAIRVAGTAASRRGLALGLVVSAYAAGTVVVAPVADALLDTVGRAWTFAVLAAVVGGLVLVAAALVPGTRPAARADRRTDPPSTPASPRTRPARGSRRGPSGPRLGPIPALWLVFGLGSAPGLAAFGNAGALAGPGVAAFAVPVLSLGNFAGRLVAGPTSDRVGRETALHLTTGVLVVTCALLAVVDGAALRGAGLCVLGLQYGALSALVPAATSDVVPASRLGTSYGLVFTGWGTAGLLAPVAASHLVDEVGTDAVFLAFLALGLVAWGTLTVARPASSQAARVV